MKVEDSGHARKIEGILLTLPYGRYARKSLVDLVNWKEFTM